MGAVAAFGDDDGFGEAVLGAAAVGVDEELEEAEAEFEDGGAVAESALDRVPEGEVRMDDRENADAEEPFSGRTPFHPPGEDAEIKDGGKGVIQKVGPLVADACEFGAVFVVEHEPLRTNLDVDILRERVPGEFAPGKVEQGSCNDGCGEDDDDDETIEHKGDGAAPEGCELDAVELEEPGGLVCREGAHAPSVAGDLLFWAWKSGEKNRWRMK